MSAQHCACHRKQLWYGHIFCQTNMPRPMSIIAAFYPHDQLLLGDRELIKQSWSARKLLLAYSRFKKFQPEHFCHKLMGVAKSSAQQSTSPPSIQYLEKECKSEQRLLAADGSLTASVFTDSSQREAK